MNASSKQQQAREFLSCRERESITTAISVVLESTSGPGDIKVLTIFYLHKSCKERFPFCLVQKLQQKNLLSEH